MRRSIRAAVGFAIAKNAFHVYGVDAQDEKVLSRKARRAGPRGRLRKAALPDPTI